MYRGFWTQQLVWKHEVVGLAHRLTPICSAVLWFALLRFGSVEILGSKKITIEGTRPGGQAGSVRIGCGQNCLTRKQSSVLLQRHPGIVVCTLVK